MKLNTAMLAALLAQAANAWKVGDRSTGMTDPGVTSKCTLWANDIASDDSCKALQSKFDISYLQLHEWNPSLLKYPCVPIEGWSYCVASSSPTNSNAAGMGTKAPTLHFSASTESATASPTESATSSATTPATKTSSGTTGSASATQTGAATSLTPSQDHAFAVAAIFLGVSTLL